jgi:predicted phosphodiesterase
LTRRDFLRASGSAIPGLALGISLAHADEVGSGTRLRFGIVADAHYADCDARGVRHYRESTAKMAECVALMNDEKVDFVVELGDFKDQDVPAVERKTLEYLETIEGVLAEFSGPRYHVLGNHDLDSISKQQFLSRVENTGIQEEAGFYSFDSGGLHFVVLDANYRSDGSDYDHGKFDWTDANVPESQLEWLRADLAATSTPVIGFIHQQLDGGGNHRVRNADQVLRILEESGHVLAVFQGHNHAGDTSFIEGIHYYTLKAMVDGSGEASSSYAVVEVRDNDDVTVTGYRRAADHEMKAAD